MTRLNWEKANRRERSFSQVDHNCPGCGMALYSKLPFCYTCFKQGKYTKYKPRTAMRSRQHSGKNRPN